MSYNNSRSKNLGCTITPVILNLHHFKRDSYIFVICRAFIMQRMAEKRMRTPTQQTARSQNTGTGILGNIQKIKASRLCGCLFLMWGKIYLIPLLVEWVLNQSQDIMISERIEFETFSRRKEILLWYVSAGSGVYYCRINK